jgi:uncharacterized glyoxalase superfamily protein PhnB
VADPTSTDPDKYEVVFENERVRVLEYRDAPGQRTSPHDHPDSVMITLSGFQGNDRPASHSVHVRVDDVDAHHDRAAAAGASIVSAPTDYPYGERQYTVEDHVGRRWTFSQSIADVDPADWGGTLADDG